MLPYLTNCDPGDETTWAGDEPQTTHHRETDGPTDFRERAIDAGYDPGDPKALTLEQWGAL